jgi:hypothetical protein
MWTHTPEGHQAIADVSRRLVAQFAPEELGLFPELLADYFARPNPVVPLPSDDPLAFGIGDAVVAFTPIVASMATAALSFVYSETAKAFAQEAASVVKSSVKGMFGRPSAPRLTPAQLAQVRAVALDAGIKRGLRPDRAGQIADALIGAIVLAPPVAEQGRS